MSYQSILDDLKNLTEAELRDVRNSCSALLSMPASMDNSTDVMFILSIIQDVIQAKTRCFVPIKMFTQAKSFPSFKIKVGDLMSAMRKQAFSRMGQRVILHEGIAMLYDLIVRENVIFPTAVALMNNIHRVVACLDAAFPGYLEAGMLSYVLVDNTKGDKFNGQ